ncbi:MAG TPA: hypothetical protein VFK74_02700 [Azospira sp.]|nr:hypothetical protein [Azospira sp.]
MSPLSRKRILIGLSPERLSALALGGLLRPHLLDRHAVLLHGQDAGEWEQGMPALEALLAEPAWGGGNIRIVLSGHYVRHAIIPAGSNLSVAERQVLAEAVFRDTFGDLARDWELRVSLPSPGKRTLASGVPRGLLAALRGACAKRGRLDSIQPALMPIFNHVRREIGDSVACLALVEPGRTTLAFVEHGQWKYIDSRAGTGGALPQLLLEESELNQRQPGGILWLCDLSDSARLPGGSFWSHREIEPPALAGFDGISNLAIWGAA